MSSYHPFKSGSQFVTNGLISTFNSNTLGNLYTTGGNVGINNNAPAYNLDVSGTINASSSIQSASVSTGSLNSTGLTTGNINFTGALYQNGVAYVGSQWTSTSGNVSYTSGSVVSGTISASNIISTSSSMGNLNSIGLTTGNINFTGALYQNGVAYVGSQWTSTSGNVSYTSGGVIATTASIGSLYVNTYNPANINTTNMTANSFIVNNLTTGTLVTNNVNVGVGSIFGGSFAAANNVASPSNVTGFVFNSSNVVSFSANVSVVINATSNLYESFTLNGTYSSSGWVLNSSSRGDVSGIVFTITSGGQVQYTSTNVSGWSSSAIRFTVNQMSVSGSYSSLAAPTSGNTYFFDSINLTNTNDSLSLSSTGSMNIAGGLTVQKSLYANAISTSNFMITNLTTANFVITNTSAFTNFTTSNVVANNVNVGINSMWGGSFAAANNVASPSNVTGFSFNSSSVVSFSANVSVVINASSNLYESFTLNGTYSSSGWIMTSTGRGDASGVSFTITSGGQVQYTSTNVAGWTSSAFRFAVNQNSISGNYSSLSAPTSGNTYFFDSINLTNTNDSLSLSSTGSMNIAGGLTVQKSLYANAISTSNFMITNLTAANFAITNTSLTNVTTTNLVANNVNVGIASIFGGSFAAANNVASPANVTGLSFNSSSVVSFTANVSIAINATANLYESYTFNGCYSSTGWVLNTVSRGDISGIVFTITSGGQVQYTSTNISGWTSALIRFSVTQNSLSGNYSSLAAPTSGNTYIYDSINLTNTSDAVAGSSSGSLYVSGGATIAKSLFVGSQISTGSIFANNVTIGNLTVTGMTTTVNVTESNVVDTNITTGTLNATGITTGNINFTGNLYQNGVAYSPGASLKGFQVSATTGNSLGIPYVAVGQGTNSIAYSYDGITWTGLGTSIFSVYGCGVAYNGTNRWVAVGSGANSIAYSSDGITWTGLGTSIFSNEGRGVAYSAALSRWVAVGNGANTIAYSSDGITWTGLGTSIFSNGGYGVAYSAALSRWVAVGGGTNSIAYSSDGITWTGLGTSIFSEYGRGVAYNGSNRWVAVGNGTNSIAYSSDGITWTGLGTSIFSEYGRGVAYNGSNRWVAVGQGTNTIAYSSDGISWTGVGTSIFSGYGWGVAYNGSSRWVAVGGGTNSIAYSSDGISWTGLGTSIFSSIGYSVAYNGSSRWVAVGAGTNSIAYSSDGITWTGLGTSIFSLGYSVASNSSATSSLVVTGQRVQYNTNSNYNNTTGTFTAPSSGIYIINLSGTGNVYITSANTFIPTQGNYTTNAYISAGNTLKCVVSGGAVYNWGVNYL